jgi:hypothetical protein
LLLILIFLIFFFCASSLNHGDEQFGFDVLKGTSGDHNYNPPAPWEELVKHTVSEKTLGHEYRTTASISDPSLRKSDWVTPSLPLKQPGLQRGNNSSFPGELVIFSCPLYLEFHRLIIDFLDILTELINK